MYKCLQKNHWEDDAGYQLVPIREGDVESIRVWRNAQMDILRQNRPIDHDEQQKYFQEIIFPGFQQSYPPLMVFSFLHDKKCIGYGGLVHIKWDWKHAEISFLVSPERVESVDGYERDFFHFLGLVSQVAFSDLSLHRLFTETFAFREGHIHILERFGFKYEGTLREHVFKKGQWVDSILHGILLRELQTDSNTI